MQKLSQPPVDYSAILSGLISHFYSIKYKAWNDRVMIMFYGFHTAKLYPCHSNLVHTVWTTKSVMSFSSCSQFFCKLAVFPAKLFLIWWTWHFRQIKSLTVLGGHAKRGIRILKTGSKKIKILRVPSLHLDLKKKGSCSVIFV